MERVTAFFDDTRHSDITGMIEELTIRELDTTVDPLKDEQILFDLFRSTSLKMLVVKQLAVPLLSVKLTAFCFSALKTLHITIAFNSRFPVSFLAHRLRNLPLLASLETLVIYANGSLTEGDEAQVKEDRSMLQVLDALGRGESSHPV